MRFRIRTAAVGCVWVALTSAAAAADHAAPFDLGVRITFGSNALFEDVLAEQLSLVLVEELRSRGCFRSVTTVADDTRVPGFAVLKVRVDDHWTRTTSEIGLAQQQRDEHPDDRLRFSVEETLEGAVGLLAHGSDTAVFSKPFRTQTAHRPRFEGDDPAARTRAEILDHFAERVAGLACKEGRARLSKAPSSPEPAD